jgi:hypothetical protein
MLSAPDSAIIETAAPGVLVDVDTKADLNKL